MISPLSTYGSCLVGFTVRFQENYASSKNGSSSPNNIDKKGITCIWVLSY